MAKKVGKKPWVGEYYSLYGPLVLAPEKVRAAIAKKLSEPHRRAFVRAGDKAKEAFVAATIGGRSLYVLPQKSHTRIHVVDRRSVVLVRRGHRAYANPRTGELDELMAFDPGWTTERWAPVSKKFVVPRGGLVLFDAMAQNADIGRHKRAARSLRLPLQPGTYVVEHVARQNHGKTWFVSMLFIHPASHRPPLVAKKAPPRIAVALAITSGVAAAARKLAFVQTTGGPLLFLPARLAPHWWGVCNEAGKAVFDVEPTDYDRACATRGDAASVKVKGETVLVLGSPDPGAFVATKGGALIVRWVGADHAAATLAPALGPATFSRTKLRIRSRGEPWVLMDSSLDGRTLKKAGKGEWSRATLPSGIYRVETMNEWHGEVALGGKASDVSASAVRLTR